MVLRSRREYLEAIRSRYRQASREEKAVILDEFCLNCGYNRKNAVRLLRKKKDVAPYNAGQVLGLRMTANLSWYLSSASGLLLTRCAPRN